jgi:hypothetical protein
MALKVLKPDATQEEINAWILESSQAFTTLETELEDKKKRITSLEEHNQKMFLAMTSQVKNEDKQDTAKIPDFLTKDTYEMLDKKDKQLLEEIMEEE